MDSASLVPRAERRRRADLAAQRRLAAVRPRADLAARRQRPAHQRRAHRRLARPRQAAAHSRHLVRRRRFSHRRRAAVRLRRSLAVRRVALRSRACLAALRKRRRLVVVVAVVQLRRRLVAVQQRRPHNPLRLAALRQCLAVAPQRNLRRLAARRRPDSERQHSRRHLAVERRRNRHRIRCLAAAAARRSLQQALATRLASLRNWAACRLASQRPCLASQRRAWRRRRRSQRRRRRARRHLLRRLNPLRRLAAAPVERQVDRRLAERQAAVAVRVALAARRHLAADRCLAARPTTRPSCGNLERPSKESNFSRYNYTMHGVLGVHSFISQFVVVGWVRQDNRRPRLFRTLLWRRSIKVKICTRVIERIQIRFQIGKIIVRTSRTEQHITIADVAPTGVIRKRDGVRHNAKHQIRGQLSDSSHRAARDRGGDGACLMRVFGDVNHCLVNVCLKVLACAMALHGFKVVFATHVMRSHQWINDVLVVDHDVVVDDGNWSCIDVAIDYFTLYSTLICCCHCCVNQQRGRGCACAVAHERPSTKHICTCARTSAAPTRRASRRRARTRRATVQSIHRFAICRHVCANWRATKRRSLSTC